MSNLIETIKQEKYAFALCILLIIAGAYLATVTFDKKYIAEKISYECKR